MGDERAAVRSQRLDVIAISVPLVVLLGGMWSRRWLSDDGFINLRIVEQLWAGHGPVWNVGERVETGTSPLWLGVLAVVAGVLRVVELEWVAVVLGIACTLAGLAAAAMAARSLHRDDPRPLVPLGALVVAATPAFWDFASSGLETGLSFLWLGGGGWALAVVAGNPQATLRRRTLTGVLLGLGPLVRPDLALVALPMLVALLVSCRPLGWRRSALVVTAAAAAPLAYQAFRMAYFAALVPNTAFAKEGGRSSWATGWAYAADHVGTWRLWWPAALILVVALLGARRGRRAEERWPRLVTGSLVSGAALHALYIVRVGGDFMHARLLLPATFALLLPWAVVPARRVTVTALVALVPWAVLAALVWLPPGRPGSGAADGVVDERAYYVALAGQPNPVTADDFAGVAYAIGGRLAADVGPDGHGELTFRTFTPDDPTGWTPSNDPAAPFVVAVDNVGLFGFLAGPDVTVIDLRGLGDPVTSRFRLEGDRGRPGHEKAASPAWVLGRLAAAGADFPPDVVADPAEVEAARQAVGCGDLADVLAGISKPLTPGRARSNLVLALTTYSLRISAAPTEARDELCAD